MTARQVYEGLLIELNKTEAPPLLLEDFNYIFQKGINQYVNKRYNIYDVNQQTTDDLRVLKASMQLTPAKSTSYNASAKGNLYGATYEVDLPPDYLHMLSCMCEYTLAKQIKCYNEGQLVYFPARRLTSDSWSMIAINPYMSPMYKRPYYFINNVNSAVTANMPSNPHTASNEGSGLGTGTDGALSRSIQIGGKTESLVEKNATHRFGNPTSVRMEIRYGRDDSVFQLNAIYIDYLKAPQLVRLTQEQIDLTEDTSQMMEFPDYVCQEIINELVKLVMEQSSDPRLQTNLAVNQTIAPPVQQESQKSKK